MKSLCFALLMLFGCNIALAQAGLETIALMKRANAVLEKLKQEPAVSTNKTSISLFDNTNPPTPLKK